MICVGQTVKEGEAVQENNYMFATWTLSPIARDSGCTYYDQMCRTMPRENCVSW